MSTLIGVLTRRLTTSISAWMRRQVSYIRTRCMKNFTSSLAEKASFTISRQYFYGRRSVSCQEAEHIAKKISYGQKWEPLFDYSDVARRTDVYNLPAVMYCIRSAPLSVISRINALRLFQLRFPKPRPPLCVDVQGLLWSVFRAPLFTCSIYIYHSLDSDGGAGNKLAYNMSLISVFFVCLRFMLVLPKRQVRLNRNWRGLYQYLLCW